MKIRSGLLVIVIAVFMLTLINGCKTTGLTKEQQVTQFKKMYWLVGSWQNQSPDMTMTEEWKKVNDTLLLGTSTMLLGGDTIYAEDIKLEPGGINIAYSIISHSGDKTERSSYILKKNQGGTLVFENPANKEQNRVSYKRKSNDNIIIKVEGMDGNKVTTEVYYLKRVVK